MGELGLCRIVLDLGVAGDGVTTDDPADGGEEVDMRSQVRARNNTKNPEFRMTLSWKYSKRFQLPKIVFVRVRWHSWAIVLCKRC